MKNISWKRVGIAIGFMFLFALIPAIVSIHFGDSAAFMAKVFVACACVYCLVRSGK